MTFRLGVNHLADLTQAEYADSLSPMKRDAKRLSDVKLFNEAQVAAAKGDNVDWREVREERARHAARGGGQRVRVSLFPAGRFSDLFEWRRFGARGATARAARRTHSAPR